MKEPYKMNYNSSNNISGINIDKSEIDINADKGIERKNQEAKEKIEKENKEDYNIDEETTVLLKDKKKKLQNKLGEIKKKLEDMRDIEIYDIPEKDERNQNSEKISNRIGKNIFCSTFWGSYFLGLLYLIFYLIGFFQLLYLFNTSEKELGIIFKSFFFDKIRDNNSTFKELYINSCLKNIPEFDFAFITSFIGSLPLKYCGFFISSLIFTILNSVSFVIFNEFNFEKEKFDVKDFLFILIFFILFFILFGAISLFSHEKLYEGIFKLLIAGGDTNKEDKKILKIVHFITICIGIILAYILNRLINLLAYDLSGKSYEDNFIIIFLSIYLGSYLLSLIFYLFFFVKIALIDNQIENEKKFEINYWKFCGYLIYCEKRTLNNEENEANYNKHNESNKTEKDNTILSNNIIIYNGNIYNGNIYKNNNYNYYYEIILPICFPCYNYCKKDNKYSCASCKLGCRKCFYNLRKSEFFLFACECCKCEECCGCCSCCYNCCLCCQKLELKETYEEEENFCYAYKVQRKCSWFCDILFRKGIMSLIICNILTEIGNIGFEKKLNENLENQSLYKDFLIIGIYLAILLFRSIISSIGICGIVFPFDKFEKDKKDEDFTGISSSIIISYFDIIILSGFSYFGKNKLKEITDDYLILIPISWAKIFNFMIIESLVNILKEEETDILSGSFIMTCIFFVYDIIVFVITDLIDLKSDIIIIFQFAFGILVFIFYLFIIIIIIKKNCNEKK